MHDREPHHRAILPGYENISRTRLWANGEEPTERGHGCVFIEPYTWPAGFPPFCGRPVLAGSPYCPAHAALCAGPMPEVRR